MKSVMQCMAYQTNIQSHICCLTNRSGQVVWIICDIKEADQPYQHSSGLIGKQLTIETTGVHQYKATSDWADTCQWECTTIKKMNMSCGDGDKHDIMARKLSCSMYLNGDSIAYHTDTQQLTYQKTGVSKYQQQQWQQQPSNMTATTRCQFHLMLKLQECVGKVGMQPYPFTMSLWDNMRDTHHWMRTHRVLHSREQIAHQAHNF
jgi:hypothetical protein